MPPSSHPPLSSSPTRRSAGRRPGPRPAGAPGRSGRHSPNPPPTAPPGHPWRRPPPFPRLIRGNLHHGPRDRLPQSARGQPPGPVQDQGPRRPGPQPGPAARWPGGDDLVPYPGSVDARPERCPRAGQQHLGGAQRDRSSRTSAPPREGGQRRRPKLSGNELLPPLRHLRLALGAGSRCRARRRMSSAIAVCLRAAMWASARSQAQIALRPARRRLRPGYRSSSPAVVGGELAPAPPRRARHQGPPAGANAPAGPAYWAGELVRRAGLARTAAPQHGAERGQCPGSTPSGPPAAAARASSPAISRHSVMIAASSLRPAELRRAHPDPPGPGPGPPVRGPGSRPTARHPIQSRPGRHHRPPPRAATRPGGTQLRPAGRVSMDNHIDVYLKSHAFDSKPIYSIKHDSEKNVFRVTTTRRINPFFCFLPGRARESMAG